MLLSVITSNQVFYELFCCGTQWLWIKFVCCNVLLSPWTSGWLKVILLDLSRKRRSAVLNAFELNNVEDAFYWRWLEHNIIFVSNPVETYYLFISLSVHLVRKPPRDVVIQIPYGAPPIELPCIYVWWSLSVFSVFLTVVNCEIIDKNRVVAAQWLFQSKGLTRGHNVDWIYTPYQTVLRGFSSGIIPVGFSSHI